jgi:RNA polymerase sigma factor (sigma-70 family)
LLNDFEEGRIDKFYEVVYPSLLLFVNRILGPKNTFLAEDCVQEAIYKTYGQRHRFIDANQFRAYLYSSVHNQAVSLLRKDNSKANYASQTDLGMEDLSTAIIRQETLDRLARAIATLPPELQDIFHLSFEEGLKNLEVAQRLGISESGVKKRKMKMIGILRDYFKEDTMMLMVLWQLLGH